MKQTERTETFMTQIWNTPGYYFSIAYWMSATVIAVTGGKRKRDNILKQAALSAGLLALLLGFMFLTAGVQGMRFAVSMALILMWICLYLHLMGGFEKREAIFLLFKAFIEGEFSASLCWQIVYYFMAPEMRSVRSHALMLIIFIILSAGIFALEIQLNRGMEELEVSWKEIAITAILAVVVFTMSNLSYITRDSLFSGRMAIDIFNIRTLVDLSGVALVYAFQAQMREVQLRFERETLRSIMEMQYRTYQLSRETIDLVDRKYHDLKHQILLLKSEAGSESAAGNLEKMEKEIRIYETQIRTGCRVLDAVLTVKTLYCQSNGIELKCMADGTLLDFMEDMEISALFGNMLDNAIECVEQLQEKEKRRIRLEVCAQKQFVKIRTENYCDEKLAFRDGMPVTSKKDRQLHGYGMKSMRKTVEKYGGTVRAEQEEDRFILMILIPQKTFAFSERI